MNIALLGYGKMGKIIEQFCCRSGHQVVLKIDADNLNDLTPHNLKKSRTLPIDFSNP